MSNNNNGQLMGMILGGNNLNTNNLQSSQSSNQNNFANSQASPFTDNLNYNPQAQIRVPQSNALNTPTLNDYKKELPVYSAFPLQAPGRLAPLPAIPTSPFIARPAGLSQSRSLTANLRNDPILAGPNRNQPLFPENFASNNRNNNNNMSNNNNRLYNTNGLMGNRFMTAAASTNNAGFMDGSNGLLASGSTDNR